MSEFTVYSGARANITKLRSSKTLRRAWTHVPDVNVMMLHLAEIKSFCALVDRVGWPHSRIVLL